ncbi:ATP-binding protein [Nonomuraea insulae]|uniref:ATP-binding protein n=1 Tax=Nonomuraea insulae TaxID=1616787 RepID=A0ABW1D0V5_9ACTN
MSERFLAEAVVPGAESSVPLLRHYVTLVLTAAGHPDPETMRLVLTELASNAVVHTRSGSPGGLVTVEVFEISDRLARVEVTDDGAQTIPQPRQAEDDANHGRGLCLVEAMSARWGVRPGTAGTTVWAEVLTEEAAPPTTEPTRSIDAVEA